MVIRGLQFTYNSVTDFAKEVFCDTSFEIKENETELSSLILSRNYISLNSLL